MPYLEIHAKGDQAAVRRLERMARHMEDIRPLGHQLLQVLEEGERRMWARPRGQRWPPLAQSTIERKRRQGLPPRILVASGALRDSLIGSAQGAVREVTSDTVRFGTTVLEAKFQVKGTAKPAARGASRSHRVRGKRDPGTLHSPPRKVLAIGAREKRELKNAIAHYLVDG